MPQKIRNVVFSLQKIKIALLATTLSFLFQSTIAAPNIPDLPTQIKIAIDPARVKKMGKPERKPADLIIPSAIEEAKKKATKPISKQPQKADAIKFKLSSIEIMGSTVYKNGELLQYYKSYLNKNVSLSDLKDITNNITSRYRKDGYIISQAILPPQKIAGGKVIIQVIEGYISEIYIEGKSKKVQNLIEKYAEEIKRMKPLQTKKLERYVLLINDSPGLLAKTILSPSTSKLGAADLTFVLEQERIVGDIYFDNRGTPYMGPEQTIASLSIRDALTAADEITLQTIFTPFHSELRHAQLTYSLPIGISGLRLSADGAFTETRPGFILEPFGFIGRSKSFGADLKYPVIRLRTKNLWLYGKIDWLDTYTDFAGGVLFKDQIRSVRAGVSYDFIDKLRGASIISAEFSKGLKIFNASPANPTKIPTSRKHGLSDYKKINIDISRYQNIRQDLVLLAAISSQYSFHNQLLSSEEFSFGGGQFGRAYNSSELVGDSGINGKLELRFNTFPEFDFLQQIQYYTFYDIGVIWNVGAEEDFTQASKDSASNIGGGLRATFNGYIYGNIEIAKPLTRVVDTHRQQNIAGKAWSLHFGLGVNL